jgi:hypothetical protein
LDSTDDFVYRKKKKGFTFGHDHGGDIVILSPLEISFKILHKRKIILVNSFLKREFLVLVLILQSFGLGRDMTPNVRWGSPTIENQFMLLFMSHAL